MPIVLQLCSDQRPLHESRFLHAFLEPCKQLDKSRRGVVSRRARAAVKITSWAHGPTVDTTPLLRLARGFCLVELTHAKTWGFLTGGSQAGRRNDTRQYRPFRRWPPRAQDDCCCWDAMVCVLEMPYHSVEVVSFKSCSLACIIITNLVLRKTKTGTRTQRTPHCNQQVINMSVSFQMRPARAASLPPSSRMISTFCFPLPMLPSPTPILRAT